MKCQEPAFRSIQKSAGAIESGIQNDSPEEEKALCEKCLTFSQIQKERWRKNVKIVRSIKQSLSLLKQYKTKKAKVPITDKKYCSQIRQQNEEGFRHNMGVLEIDLKFNIEQYGLQLSKRSAALSDPAGQEYIVS